MYFFFVNFYFVSALFFIKIAIFLFLTAFLNSHFYLILGGFSTSAFSHSLVFYFHFIYCFVGAFCTFYFATFTYFLRSLPDFLLYFFAIFTFIYSFIHSYIIIIIFLFLIDWRKIKFHIYNYTIHWNINIFDIEKIWVVLTSYNEIGKNGIFIDLSWVAHT